MLPERSRRTAGGTQIVVSIARHGGRLAALQSTISVPAEDDAVQRAFDELDAQMNAWLSGMQRLGAALLQDGTTLAPADIDTAEQSEAAEPIAAPPVFAAERKPAEPPAKIAAVAPPVVVKPVPAPLKPEPPAAIVVEPVRPPPAPPVTQPAVNEDEALLATLDPETAKVIRVMRRLAADRKSVRELLAEYQAGRSSQVHSEVGKKSWWRRK